jgi:octaprenyl-diphosphate synthase
MLGARFAGGNDELVSRMELFGMSLGTAFQIQDDILDIVGQTQTVGKTLGIDIEKGKMTLPIIHFMRTAPREHRHLLRSLLKGKDADKVERIRDLILPSPSIDYAREKARRLIDRARVAIEAIPDNEAKRALDVMAEFVITRPM